MPILAEKTDKNALYEIAKTLRFFENLSDLKMSAEDAFKCRTAENAVRGIIETNGYKANYSNGTGTVITKI
jgi:hypothetical protein